MTHLSIPEIAADTDTLTAAWAYAGAGWYVLPTDPAVDIKDPGSVVGKGWPAKSSRDPKQLAAWFAGTDYGIALHAGRSGAVIFDVDNPDKLPDVLRKHLAMAPFQSTRPAAAGRGHYIFLQPPGRTIGNGLGRLATTPKWGEVRGLNGVFIAEPTPHPEGGRYKWVRRGAPMIIVLPDGLAELLDDASPAEDAASDAAVAAFIAGYQQAGRPEILHGWTKALATKVEEGASRHTSAVSVVTGALKEARCGYFAAKDALAALKPIFINAVALGDNVRTGARAESEWNGIVAWAVAQALAADLDEVRARTEDKMPNGVEWVDRIGSDSPADATVGDGKKLTDSASSRQPRITWANTIDPEPVVWAWRGNFEDSPEDLSDRILESSESSGEDFGRVAAGTLAVAGGREGEGKSSFVRMLAAKVSTGTLPGSWYGTPRNVLYATAEESWKHTMVPGLIAAGADLSRVGRFDIITDTDNAVALSLPVDNQLLGQAIIENDIAVVALDPLLSMISDRIDSHRERDVRLALDPLAALADRTGAVIFGIAHFNKATGSDISARITGSGAFKNVPRAVFGFAPTPTRMANTCLPSRRTLSAATTCRRCVTASNPRRSTPLQAKPKPADSRPSVSHTTLCKTSSTPATPAVTSAATTGSPRPNDSSSATSKLTATRTGKWPARG